jgi:hypothetical protein
MSCGDACGKLAPFLRKNGNQVASPTPHAVPFPFRRELVKVFRMSPSVLPHGAFGEELADFPRSCIAVYAGFDLLVILDKGLVDLRCHLKT